MQHPFFDGTMWENLHSGMANLQSPNVFPHACEQNRTLRTSTSRSSHTTKIFPAHRRLVCPIRSTKYLRLHPPHSHFPPSSSRPKQKATADLRHCARPPTLSFAKRQSRSSSAFHGVPQKTRSPTLLSRHHLPHLQLRCARETRSTIQYLKYHWRPSSKRLCGASAPPVRGRRRGQQSVQARSDAQLRAAPSQTERRCVSS
jgi:hypothetical protein